MQRRKQHWGMQQTERLWHVSRLPMHAQASRNVAISSRHALCSCRACVCSKAVTCAAIHQQAEQHQQARCVLGPGSVLAARPDCPQPSRNYYGHTPIACHAGTTDVSFPTWHGSAATEPTQQQAGLAGDALAAAAEAQGSPNVTVQQGSAVPAAARARSNATEGAGVGAASKAADASFGDWAGQGHAGSINQTTGE